VRESISRVNQHVHLPPHYRFEFAGETVSLIFLIIYGAFASAYVTGTHFSVSSGIGFLALFGASVQTGLIRVERINQLRVGSR
jgi:cobalt-zinc-cadmium resistance protein CzcA